MKQHEELPDLKSLQKIYLQKSKLAIESKYMNIDEEQVANIIYEMVKKIVTDNSNFMNQEDNFYASIRCENVKELIPKDLDIWGNTHFVEVSAVFTNGGVKINVLYLEDNLPQHKLEKINEILENKNIRIIHSDESGKPYVIYYSPLNKSYVKTHV